MLCNRYPCVKVINIQKPTTITVIFPHASPTEADQPHGYKATTTQLSTPYHLFWTAKKDYCNEA